MNMEMCFRPKNTQDDDYNEDKGHDEDELPKLVVEAEDEDLVQLQPLLYELGHHRRALSPPLRQPISVITVRKIPKQQLGQPKN